jgi:hypothetical protein
MNLPHDPSYLPQSTYNCYIENQTTSFGHSIKAWSRRNEDEYTGNIALRISSNFINSDNVILYADLLFCNELSTIYVTELIGCDFSDFSKQYGKPFHRAEDDEEMFDILRDVLRKQYPSFTDIVELSNQTLPSRPTCAPKV